MAAETAATAMAGRIPEGGVFDGSGADPFVMRMPGFHSTALGAHDIVGQTFYIAANMMLAFTLFFFVQASLVPKQWRTSVTVAGIVTGIAWYNYNYMKSVWIYTQESPTVYRYCDWLITVPLQIVEFYFILEAAGKVPGALGVRLLFTSLVMLFGGWFAETDQLDKVSGFVIGMSGWLYILYEVFAGEASRIAVGLKGNKSAQQAFYWLRLIVSVGWSIYPIGYAVAFIISFGGWAPNSYMVVQVWRNVIYNLADLVNKGAFGMCVWSAATSAESSAATQAY